jgi:hypothetical protein
VLCMLYRYTMWKHFPSPVGPQIVIALLGQVPILITWRISKRLKYGELKSPSLPLSLAIPTGVALGHWFVVVVPYYSWLVCRLQLVRWPMAGHSIGATNTVVGHVEW